MNEIQIQIIQRWWRRHLVCRKQVTEWVRQLYNQSEQSIKIQVSWRNPGNSEAWCAVFPTRPRYGWVRKMLIIALRLGLSPHVVWNVVLMLVRLWPWLRLIWVSDITGAQHCVSAVMFAATSLVSKAMVRNVQIILILREGHLAIRPYANCCSAAIAAYGSENTKCTIVNMLVLLEQHLASWVKFRIVLASANLLLPMIFVNKDLFKEIWAIVECSDLYKKYRLPLEKFRKI